MKPSLKSLVMASVVVIGLGSAPRAAEVSITINRQENALTQRIADYGDSGEYGTGREYGAHQRYERETDSQFHGHSIPEWRNRRSQWGAPYGVPVVERRGWHPGRGERSWGCRVVVKERINQWGDRVQIRKEICR